jgi:hypothetical protein
MAIKGLTQTSSLITIGFSNTESAANTFTQSRVDLQLNPLDNEVFVVQAINLDPLAPDVVPGSNTQTNCSLTSTTQTAIATLAESSCIANTTLDIRTQAALVASAGVPFTRTSMETPPTGLEYIAIIATNDFFTQVKGNNNLQAKGVTGKMYGFRAKASSAIYSALVQSELLSA